MMAAEIITRAEAMARGLKHYFTGKPCCRGHIAPRNVDRRNCPVCLGIFYRSEDQLAKGRERYKRGGRAAIERATNWARNNPEKAKAYRAAWGRKNRHKALEYVHRRRALKEGSASEITAEQILWLKEKQRGKCANCFQKLGSHPELDHIVALSKGGAHVLSNAQFLCRTCNRKKHTKDPIAWAQENGRLL